MDLGEQDDEYFIRSTVLGGTVISEVGPTGKKKQTFVYAAGSKIAQQTEHVYQSTTYENVTFSHTDGSGLSGRNSTSSGIAFTDGINYEGAPVETDPLGGNMGTETPYVEFPPEPPPPDEDFPAFAVNEADRFYINGHRATMIVDGMAVSHAVGAMFLRNDHGSLGLDLLQFSVVQSSKIKEWRFHGPDHDLRFGVGKVSQYGVDLLNRGLVTAYATLDNSWSAINLIAPQQNKKRLTDDQVTKLVQDVEEILKYNPDCQSFIMNVFANLPKGLKVNAKDLTEILNQVHKQEGIWFTKNADFNNADGGGIDHGKGRIELEGPSQASSVSFTPAGRRRFDRGQELKVAQIALDEAVHAVGPGFKDFDLYRAFAKWKGIPLPDIPEKPPAGTSIAYWTSQWSAVWHPEMHRSCSFSRVPVR